MKFTRVELRNWKNFPKADVKLASRVFIIGPNASGKSNFLEAFKFLRDLALPGGGLAEACRVRGGVKRIRSVFARRNPEVQIKVEVAMKNGERWSYDLAFTNQPKTETPVIVHEIVRNLSAEERGEIEGPILNRPSEEDGNDPEQLTQTAIEQTTANKDFREVAEFFRTIRYLHLVPQVVREGASKPDSVISEDSMGRDLLDRMWETPKKTRDARLKQLQEALEVAVPSFESLELIKDDRGRPHLRVRFAHWRPAGAFQDETQFSDGTLRLIGLLWSLMERSGPLLLEEPELSLHSALLTKLGPLIHRAQKSAKGRQIILSTHSEHMLRDEGIGPEEILFIEVKGEGSTIVEAASVPDIVAMMNTAGLTVSEAVLPRTKALQADLFDKVGL
ncbi:MAG: AAA family ATPase [Sumerlaeia bacterium]